MELIWFEDYLALAETLNFSRAAEARHVTQPAFSRRIRALEEWMARYPGFELTDPAAVTWSSGQVRGPRTIPVRVSTGGAVRRADRADPGDAALR